ncbi:Uncharacterized protein APZ42_005830, partial [Daphnia magna]
RSRKHYETFECLETSLDVGAEKKLGSLASTDRIKYIYRSPKMTKTFGNFQFPEFPKFFWRSLSLF